MGRLNHECRNLRLWRMARFFICYESPGRQPRMSHACISEFLGIGRARPYE